jgi:hypothetical protein
MPSKLRTALVTVAAAAVSALALFGAVTPAFAKSDTQFSGPRFAQVRHGFHLTVSVGDDSGARPASVRLQLRDAHGRYQWLGAWQRLHSTGHWGESYAFTVTENYRTTVTFRAVVNGGYAVTNPVTVIVH